MTSRTATVAQTRTALATRLWSTPRHFAISPNAEVKDYIYAGSRLIAIATASLPAR